jgi:hypothetical protein
MLLTPQLLGIQNKKDSTVSISRRPNSGSTSRSESVFNKPNPKSSKQKQRTSSASRIAGPSTQLKQSFVNGIQVPSMYSPNLYDERVRKEITKLAAGGTQADSIIVQIRALSEIALMVYAGGPYVESILYHEERDLFDYMAGVLSDSNRSLGLRMQVIQTFHSICHVPLPFTP